MGGKSLSDKPLQTYRWMRVCWFAVPSCISGVWGLREVIEVYEIKLACLKHFSEGKGDISET